MDSLGKFSRFAVWNGGKVDPFLEERLPFLHKAVGIKKSIYQSLSYLAFVERFVELAPLQGCNYQSLSYLACYGCDKKMICSCCPLIFGFRLAVLFTAHGQVNGNTMEARKIENNRDKKVL